MSSLNARLFEKDIMEDLQTAGGDSEVVDLNGATKFSCQAIYDVTAQGAKTFDSGGAEVDTGTFPDFATIAAGDYIVINDTAGLSWAVAADKDGTDPEPTGAIWTAIPAAQKAQVDLTGLTTAAQVATAFQDAFNALTAVPFVANDSTADVVFTGNLYGAVAAPSVHNEDDSGDGTIVVAVTDAGVNSEVNVEDSELTIPTNGYPTGLKGRLTTTGTLPAPFLTGTDYFVISVDASTIQLAASLDDALDGTFIEIEDQGSDEAVNTFTPTALAGATVTFQKSNSPDGPWVNIQAATTVTVDGSEIVEQANVSYRYFKVVKGLTAGDFDLRCLTLVIGPAV